ncbi:MAG: hypothetical protein MUP14_01485 [Dehalococcoidia bacterium]|nr:hypothetical protein [Dehalococcoidia bacterium]
MRQLLALALAAAVVGSLLGVVRSRSTEGFEPWFKFLFTPQAGVDSACFSCGWHDGACGSIKGTALDFPASCTDTETVYFRSFGFNNLSSTQLSAYGTAYNLPGATCKTNCVGIYDTQAHLLGTMYYTHTFLYVGGNKQMYTSYPGTRNQSAFAGMTQAPGTPGVPESQWENDGCVNHKPYPWWTGVHLHEESADGGNTFRLRGDADCGGNDRYPCYEQPLPYPTRNPQDWRNDWARALCSINDPDCDDFTDSAEQYLDTDPQDACPDNTSDDAWPLDINKDGSITVTGDISNFSGHIGAHPGDPKWWQRLDFNADGGTTVVGDVFLYRGKVDQKCYA